MNVSKIQTLVELLRMTPEMSILMEDAEINYKFENAILSCLKKYENNPKISIKRVEGTKEHGYFISRCRVNNISECVSDFKKYYGIQDREHTYKEIAKKRKVGHQGIKYRVNMVVDLLRSRHKRDIWYGSI